MEKHTHARSTNTTQHNITHKTKTKPKPKPQPKPQPKATPDQPTRTIHDTTRHNTTLPYHTISYHTKSYHPIHTVLYHTTQPRRLRLRQCATLEKRRAGARARARARAGIRPLPSPRMLTLRCVICVHFLFFARPWPVVCCVLLCCLCVG